jgi:hypothetical protein
MTQDVEFPPTDPATAEPAVTLTLRPASDYDRTQYGLLFESVETVDVVGPAAYNRFHPHRAEVWERPECTGGFHTRELSAESVVISDHPYDRSPVAGVVRGGDVVRLVYPDGSHLDVTVTALFVRDPALL